MTETEYIILQVGFLQHVVGDSLPVVGDPLRAVGDPLRVIGDRLVCCPKNAITWLNEILSKFVNTQATASNPALTAAPADCLA